MLTTIVGAYKYIVWNMEWERTTDGHSDDDIGGKLANHWEMTGVEWMMEVLRLVQSAVPTESLFWAFYSKEKRV